MATTELDQHIAASLRQYRIEQKLTTRKLANTTGVSQATISRVETGHAVVTVQTLRKILDSCKIPLSALSIPGVPADIDTTIVQVSKDNGQITLKEVGAYIYQERKSLNMSLRALSDQVPLSYTGVWKLEKGLLQRVRLHAIIALDNALELDGELIALTWKAFGDLAAPTL